MAVGISKRSSSTREAAMKRHSTVDDYIAHADHFQPELIRLREILQSTKLTETVKWGSPCYTFDGKMVVGLGAFKSNVGLWFFQGALLSDPESVLVNAQDGKTKALRQWRFTDLKQIKVRPIKAYVKEAIQLQQDGQEIKPDRSRPVEVPQELKMALAGDVKLKKAFDALTKGRQREYASHVADAKRAETREKRLQKIVPMIRDGVGLHDRYRSC
jgi:uncharacterized protein YdeI (YjbR/CyaY-like superfamily)